MKKHKIKGVLYIVSLILGILSIILSFTGLPGTYDAEPLLALAVVCLAIAGLMR